MADHLGTLTRTHTCGALRVEDVGSDVVVLGWVHRIRDLGGVTFLDIRDRAGISQAVVRENDALMSVAKRLRSEFVVGVSGVVQRRSADTVNPKLATGEVEILARDIRLLNEAKTPPFQIAEDGPVSEDVRLKYRYLDLRRPRLQYNMGLRHRVSIAIRKYFDANGFWEIETPILAKSTPEGARDFLVPSRLHPGEFYALPQSPQIFKQLLMIAGTAQPNPLPDQRDTRLGRDAAALPLPRPAPPAAAAEHDPAAQDDVRGRGISTSRTSSRSKRRS